ncbi:MAG: hypothetical protein WCG75_09020 [Armatimonadota bacterium]
MSCRHWTLFAAILAALCFSSDLRSAELIDIDKENGFLGVLFGSRIEAVPNLEDGWQTNDGRYVCRVRHAPVAEFPGEMDILVRFFFFDGVFFGAVVQNHSGGSAGLKKWLADRYGPGFNVTGTGKDSGGWYATAWRRGQVPITWSYSTAVSNASSTSGAWRIASSA